MRIVWNSRESRFQAEFHPDFWSQDKEAAKRVKFHCTGEPDWVWWSRKTESIDKLIKSKPVSGLAMSPEAFRKYEELKKISDQNTIVRKQLAKAKKLAKEVEVGSADETETGEFTYYKTPIQESVFWMRFNPPKPPDLRCRVCHEPVYFYEQQDPPTCLDCEFAENGLNFGD